MRDLSLDDEIWGKQIANSFSGAGEGKGNIDGETATSNVLYVNKVAIRSVLGSKAVELPRVVRYLNSKFTRVEKSRAQFGIHRSGDRIWYYISTRDYDLARSLQKKLKTLLGPNGESILRKWFCFLAVDGELYGRRRSCFECKFCVNSDFLNCTSSIKCGPWVELHPVEIEGTTRSRSFMDRLNQPEGTTLKKVTFKKIHSFSFSFFSINLKQR